MPEPKPDTLMGVGVPIARSLPPATQALTQVQASAVELQDQEKPWRPTNRQRAYLEAWLDPEQRPKTVAAICRHAHVPVRTAYAWLRHPGFTAWFDAEVARATDHVWMPVLHRAAALAMQGSVEHLKVLAQIRGVLKQPQDQAGDRGRDSHQTVVVVGVPRPGDVVTIPGQPAPGLPPPPSDSQH